MGAVVAAVLRPLIIWLVQIVVTTLIADAIASILKSTVQAVAKHYNIPEDDAKVVVTNQIIDIAALVGVGTGTLYSKLGVKTADYLGLKAVSNPKKVLAAATAAKVAAVEANPSSLAAAKNIIAGFFNGNVFWKILGPLMLFQQVGDWFIFGRPQLQGYFDAIFGKDAVKIPTATDAPPGFSNAEWSAYYGGVENAGVVGIEGGAAKATIIYSRDALANLVHFIYGQQLKIAGSTTATAIQKAAQPYLRFANTTATAAKPASVAAAAPATTSTVKVFTGVVSQGSLGNGTTFTSRPDDLITSGADLIQAAQNNLAPFLAALPGKVIYQIKVVSSVTTKDGFVQRGVSQQVQTGTNANGTPKYKTVVNKFAVMDLYLLTDKGSKTKITEVVLGPTDAINFQPTGNTLTSVENTVKSTLVTSNIQDTGGTFTTQPSGSIGAAPIQQYTASGSLAPNLSPNATAEQLANRANPTAVTVQYPTTGLFHNTGGFGEEMSKRVGNTIYRLYLLGDPFRNIFGSTIGAGAQADIVGKWLLQNFGFSVGSLPTFNYADLTTDRSIALDTGFTSPGQPGAGISDPFTLIKLFLSTNGTPAGSTSAVLNGPGSGAAVVNTPTATIDRYELIFDPNTNKWSVDDKLTGSTKYFDTRQDAEAAAPDVQLSVCQAPTLNTYYLILGKSVPSIADRATLYQALSLGQANYYTGTAEQNTKLLAALKAQAGCTA